MFYWLRGLLGLAALLSASSPASADFCSTATQVKTLQDLQNVGTTGNYCLANDIDASSTLTSPFAPLGSETNPFIGVFDGNGHVIDRLTIDQYAGNFTALFAVIGSTGTVRNVGITNSSISFNSSSSGGLLVGRNAGIVSNCFATGAVASGGAVGGLVGYNSGQVTNSHAVVVVQGSGYAGGQGGLVGVNEPSGSITQSYALGPVSFTPGGGLLLGGGFVGFNQGTITQSYATGSVTNQGYPGTVGGFVGTNGGTIGQSYATGSVTSNGGRNVGGFAGANFSKIFQSYSNGSVNGGLGFVGNTYVDGTCTSDYWDMQTSGQSNDNCPSGSTGLTTAQFKAGLPNGFDPSVWGIIPGISYPFLLWQQAPPVAANIAKTTAANTPVAIDLTEGARNNPTSAALVGTPVGGTVSGFPATTVTFTPTIGFSGAASFQFTLANAFGTSNTATATITVTPPPRPSISSVSPNPVTGSGSPQPFTINGANFVSGANITLRDKTTGEIFPNRVASSFSSTQIVINPIFTTLAHSWSVEVINPDGRSSGQFSFQVIAPPPLPPGCATGTPTIAVNLIDPYLLNAYHTNPAKIAVTSLYGVSSRPEVQAEGLVADSVSAAIAVVQTTDCSKDVRVSTSSNGITLLPYDPAFLKRPPTPGDQFLTFKAADLAANGGFAAALVQAPIGPQPIPLFPDLVNSIHIQAVQGDQVVEAKMLLVPPPVVLVHGLWGDRTSFGGEDGAGFGTLPGQGGLAEYLKERLPWLGSATLNFVQVLCYSKYFRFDADKDSILDNDNDARKGISCEQTSRDALASRIYGLLAYLDDKHYVGSRVDIVAHSMGGLAVRNYASQSWYSSLRNRNQGQFHEIITLDTPELGSELAPFLINHSSCTRQVPIDQTTSPPFLVWLVFCAPAFAVAVNPTVSQCFAAQGKPLAADGLDVATGAVYSLYPPKDKLSYPQGPRSLNNSKLSGPNIKDADWRAIGSLAPPDSALKFELDQLIAANYPPGSIPRPNTKTCFEPETSAPTIDEILKNPKNDVIVALPSQLDQPMSVPAHQHTFPGLAHIPAPGVFELDLFFGTTFSNDNVEESPDVKKLAACWLANPSDNTCTSGLPATVAASVARAAPAIAGLPASFTPVAANTAASNKNAVPMPHIVTRHPHSVDRLTLRAPASLALGKPFDLSVNTGTGGLPELHVVQSSETGTQREVPVTISRVEGQTVHLNVTPKFFGATRFQVTAAYPDGGVATKEVAAPVDYPEGPPVEFHADELAFAGIPFPVPNKPDDPGNPTLRLQPWAKWARIGPRVYINTSYVEYTIDPAPGSPVIKLSPTNGIIRGLKVGTASVTAQFRARPSTRPSKVQVNVVDKQQ